MATYNVGLNTGNTGSLICVSLAKSTPTASQVATSSSFGSTSSTQVDRMVFLASFPISGLYTVTNAKLRLVNADAAAPVTSTELRALINTFVKAEATWNKRNSSTNWNVAGALTGTDVDPTVIGTGTTSSGAQSSFDTSGDGLNAWIEGCLSGAITVPALIQNKLDDLTSFAAAKNRIRTDTGTDGLRPVLIFDAVPFTPPTITLPNITVTKYDSEATLMALLSDVAPSGGVDGVINTYDITARAGVDYVAQVDAPFEAPEGETSESVVITLLPG